MKRLAVIFPGVGYHTDKPLLYYSKKLAKQFGYEITEVPYKDLFREMRDPDKKLEAAFFSAFAQTEKMLEKVPFAEYKDVLFISKSIGTVVASTFSFAPQTGIAFHGTADPMADTQMVKEACRERQIPLYLIENGNHSLETGDVLRDIENIRDVMERTQEYIV